jgi:hypothetical protein
MKKSKEESIIQMVKDSNTATQADLDYVNEIEKKYENGYQGTRRMLLDDYKSLYSSKVNLDEPVRLTIEQTIKIEPQLKNIVNYVKQMDEIASKQVVYWHPVWRECKKHLWSMVGFAAMDQRLQDQYYWDLWHNYLAGLSKFTK